MKVLFVILFLVGSEINYLIALRQQMGLNNHISAGNVCWVNRILLLVCGIWYLGIIGGIILFIFALFTGVHATVGWIAALFTLKSSESTIREISSIESGFLIFLNIVTAIFLVISFFITKYKCALPMVVNNWVAILVVCVVGFIARVIVVSRIK